MYSRVFLPHNQEIPQPKQSSGAQRRKGRGEIGGMHLPYQLESTPQLYSWWWRGEGVQPHPHQTGLNLASWWNVLYAIKWPLPVYLCSLVLWSAEWEPRRLLYLDDPRTCSRFRFTRQRTFGGVQTTNIPSPWALGCRKGYFFVPWLGSDRSKFWTGSRQIAQFKLRFVTKVATALGFIPAS